MLCIGHLGCVWHLRENTGIGSRVGVRVGARVRVGVRRGSLLFEKRARNLPHENLLNLSVLIGHFDARDESELALVGSDHACVPGTGAGGGVGWGGGGGGGGVGGIAGGVGGGSRGG